MSEREIEGSRKRAESPACGGGVQEEQTSAEREKIFFDRHTGKRILTAFGWTIVVVAFSRCATREKEKRGEVQRQMYQRCMIGPLVWRASTIFISVPGQTSPWETEEF